MGIIGAASELDAFNIFGVVEETTVAGTFDPNFCRAAIRFGATPANDYMETEVHSSETDFWCSMDWRQSASSATAGNVWIGYNNSGTAVFRLAVSSALVFQGQYWNGSTWVNIGSTYTASSLVRTRFDWRVVCGASGSFEFYVNGVATLSGSASMTAVTNIAKQRFGSCSVAGGTVANRTHISQITWSNDSTLDHQTELEEPTGNGADTDGIGDYTAVDEAVRSDVDFIELTNAGDNNSFTSPARTQSLPIVAAVVVNGRVKRDASGPQNFRFYLTIGGMRYYGATQAATLTLAPYNEVWTTNPATGAIWTTAAADAATLEWGIEAVT